METKKPLISIVTPSYNSEEFIKDTIESVIRQTYTNWEMIIVDDCSTDNSVELIRSYEKADFRIKLIELNINSGAAVARNIAIEESKGKFIAFLDSDDIWLPEKLDTQINFMMKNNYVFSFTEYGIIYEDGSVSEKEIKIPQKVDYTYLLKNTIIGCLTVMLDKEKLGEIKMPLIRTRQDFALWLSILKGGVIAYGLQEKLAYYRKVKGSISSNKIKAAGQNWNVYRKMEGFNLFKSIWFFLHYVFFSLKKYI